MDRSSVISTWIYLDQPQESSEYPQVGKGSHLPEFQKVYWRCVTVFFELSKTFNPEKRHILFTNCPESDIPIVDGFDIRAFLKKQEVEIVTLPLTFQTPPGFFGKWRNQFYIFDIFTFFEKNFGEETALVVLDSDCLIHASLEEMFADIRRFGLLVLPLPYDEKYDINGLTRGDMQKIYTELSGTDWPELPYYWGGEIFAARYDVIRQINTLVPAVWSDMMIRFHEGRKKFNEEAHVLSYCYEMIDTVYEYADIFIKRIWTAPHYNNVSPEDVHLPIWHLPSEKTGGITLLFGQLIKGIPAQSWGSPPKLGQFVGVPKRKKFVGLKHFLKYSWIFKTVIKKLSIYL